MDFSFVMENIEWIVGACVALFGSYLTYRATLKKQEATETRDNQVMSGGSNNMQAGRDAIHVQRDYIVHHNSQGNPLEADLVVASVRIVDDPKEVVAFRQTWLRSTSDEHAEVGHFPLIDIQLLNRGTGMASATELDIRADTVELIPNRSDYRAEPVSWEYNVLLDSRKRTQRVTVALSQSIPPNGVDRFVLVVGLEAGYGELESATYELDMALKYNGAERLPLGKTTVRFYPPVFFLPEQPSPIRSITE